MVAQRLPRELGLLLVGAPPDALEIVTELRRQLALLTVAADESLQRQS